MTGRTIPIADASMGALATVAMSAVMIAGDRIGLMTEPPPTTITRAAFRKIGIDRPSEVVRLAAPLTHLAFGAAGGIAYGLVRRRIPSVPGALLGPLFALVIYGTSYKGWIPAMGILPPPERDRRGRPAVMIAAHLVYGLSLGTLVRPKQRRDHARSVTI